MGPERGDPNQATSNQADPRRATPDRYNQDRAEADRYNQQERFEPERPRPAQPGPNPTRGGRPRPETPDSRPASGSGPGSSGGPASGRGTGPGGSTGTGRRRRDPLGETSVPPEPRSAGRSGSRSAEYAADYPPDRAGPRSPDDSDGRPPTGPKPAATPPPPPRKSGRGATFSVLMMTLAALVGVGILAVQAAQAAPQVANVGQGSGNASAQANSSASPNSGTGGSTGSTNSAPAGNALPAGSGSGTRVVYSLAAKRVWLVASSGKVERTFLVVPGTVAPPTGSYQVDRKLSGETGTDGTSVQFVVLFADVPVGGQSTVFGFDAVANVAGMPAAPKNRTGGIRTTQLDAQALWNFSPLGMSVVVVT